MVTKCVVCGAEFQVPDRKLSSGPRKTCSKECRYALSGSKRKGQSRYTDISGQRFGRLVAVCPTNIKKNTCIVWRCVCDCGNECYVKSSSLRNGNTKSCGCWRADHVRPFSGSKCYNSEFFTQSRIKRYAVVDELKSGLIGHRSESFFLTPDEANAAADYAWHSLSESERQKRHIFSCVAYIDNPDSDTAKDFESFVGCFDSDLQNKMEETK